jgi:protease-4
MSNDINPAVIKEAVTDQLIGTLIKERISDRRWTIAKRIFYSIFGVGFGLIGLVVYLQKQGFKIMPNSDIIGVVRIEGEISRDGLASADKLIPVIKKAFESVNTKAVILEINSPGGSPQEASRINAAIAQIRKGHPKPLYSTIDDLGASAAYLIAIHTDKIYAGNYSLVGSIGAIMTSWDFHKAKDRLDVNQLVYASGPLKDFMNPFRPVKPEEEVKARELVRSIADDFISEVKTRRSMKIKDTGGTNLYSGTVWTGREALKLGLIDEIGTVETVAYSQKLQIYDFGPTKQSMSFPFASSMISDAIVQAWTQIVGETGNISIR